MRFIRYDRPVGHPDFGKVWRCAACCEGNQVNDDKELHAVQTYMAAYLDPPMARGAAQTQDAGVTVARPDAPA